MILAADHKLAAQKSINLKSLAKEPMVLLDLPLSRDYFLAIFRTHQLPPTIGEYASDMSVVHSLVANGYGLANIRQQVNISPDGIPLVFLPLWDKVRPMRLRIASTYLQRQTNILSAFVQHCRQWI